MAKFSFSPYLPNSQLSPTFMGPLHCFVLCLVGDCGKIVIFAIFANFYGPPSLLCALPCWRLWQNCHFCHICQIRRLRQLLWAPFTALCFPRWRLWPNLPLSPTFMGPLHCFVFFLVGDCGKIVTFAIFAKFTALVNFYGPPWQLWQNCHFRHNYQIRRSRQLLWAHFTALCFASLAIVAKLSFSPYLPNSPLSPTFMGPPHCFVFFLVGDCGKIVIFAIFAKFAAFVNFYGPHWQLWQNSHFRHNYQIRRSRQLLWAPFTALCFPRWRLWQNCHFRHICHFCQLLWAPFTALCFSSLAIVAKLSFSPYLPNSPHLSTLMGLVGDCGKIVIFAIFAKFTALVNFYGPHWQLWQNCHFRHNYQIRRFRQL